MIQRANVPPNSITQGQVDVILAADVVWINDLIAPFR